jgi:hypothetical protein
MDYKYQAYVPSFPIYSTLRSICCICCNVTLHSDFSASISLGLATGQAVKSTPCSALQPHFLNSETRILQTPIITLNITKYHAGVAPLMTSNDKIIVPVLQIFGSMFDFSPKNIPAVKISFHNRCR